MPATKKRVALFDEQGDRIRVRDNKMAAEVARAREKLSWANDAGRSAGGEWIVARVCSECRLLGIPVGVEPPRKIGAGPRLGRDGFRYSGQLLSDLADPRHRQDAHRPVQTPTSSAAASPAAPATGPCIGPSSASPGWPGATSAHCPHRSLADGRSQQSADRRHSPIRYSHVRCARNHARKHTGRSRGMIRTFCTEINQDWE